MVATQSFNYLPPTLLSTSTRRSDYRFTGDSLQFTQGQYAVGFIGINTVENGKTKKGQVHPFRHG